MRAMLFALATGDRRHAGVNSITLFHDGTRWWIMGWRFDASAES